jgi:cytidylate kinase
MKRKRGWVIAIDGPAGVGKSTVGSLVAKKLGYRFINTGEMYRALTWKALQEKLDLRDSRAIVRLAQRLRWEFKASSDGIVLRTFIDGQGVTQQIREERVSRNSSIVAGIPGVRKRLRALQRLLGKDGGIVMEGRDITTNVFPDADFKIYLDASIEERAARRTQQLRVQGRSVNFEQIREAIIARDLQDLQRCINPLRQAEDAMVVDSTHLSLHQVARRILAHIRRRGKRGA